jgi:hypothetical protein
MVGGRKVATEAERSPQRQKVAAEGEDVSVPFSGMRTSPILLNWEAIAI